MRVLVPQEAEPQKSMAELHKEKLAEDKKQKKKKRKLQENSSESESEDEEVVRAKKIKEVTCNLCMFTDGLHCLRGGGWCVY